MSASGRAYITNLSHMPVLSSVIAPLSVAALRFQGFAFMASSPQSREVCPSSSRSSFAALMAEYSTDLALSVRMSRRLSVMA